MSTATALQLRSLIKSSGELELSLASVPIPVPGDNEVLLRVEASQLNPSDQGLLFGAPTCRRPALAAPPTARWSPPACRPAR